jgi:glycosyltransferase involved in cell wall biosynthesis
MRILVTTDQWFPDFQGGSARVAAATSHELAKRGHDVTVICPQHPGLPPEAADGKLTVRRVLPRGWVPRTFSDPLHVRRIARRLAPDAYDVVIAHQPTNAVGVLAGSLGAPLALVFHASGPRELRFEQKRPPSRRRRLTTSLMGPPLAWLERRAVAGAKRILVLSEFSRGLLAADHSEALPKIRVVGGGVDTEAFTPGEGQAAARRALGRSENEALLFTVRRLDPRMGLEALLEAVALLEASHPSRLAIAGSGLLERALRRRADELGIAASVAFLGRVSDEQLRHWYQAADLFVLPTVAYEGFGMATVEALASGTPVVGTPVGATPEVLQPLDARLVASGSGARELADAISDTLARTSEELRARCRDYAVSRYDWSRVIMSWEEALQSP